METIRQNTVKTRKPHHCWGCAEEYPTGTTMDVVVSKDMGKLESTYFCDICESVLSHWNSSERSDGIGYGELKENDPRWEDTKNELRSA